MAREISASGNADLLAGIGLDDWFTRTQGSVTSRFVRDANNSTTALSNPDGTFTTFDYEPFGKATITGSTTSSYAYTGRELDPAGLYFMRNRYYNPMLQRFLSSDPIGYAGGQANLYAYVFNNPMNRADPLGLSGGGNFAGEGDPGVFSVNDGVNPGPDQPNGEIKCLGGGRGLSGNMRLIGKQGAMPGQTVQVDTAAVIPEQFGAASGLELGLDAPDIHGTIGSAPFFGVTDVVGGKSPIPGMNVRDALQQQYAGQLILEIPGAEDQGESAPVTIFVPRSLGGCPTGTGPVTGK